MATTQWMIGKTFDTFCPMGPAIVTADEIDDPHALAISLSIGGETLQSSNTSNLIFRIPQLIAYLSSVFTLEPGDIISTGTPAGVGFARKPPRWLKAGDEVRVQVEGHRRTGQSGGDGSVAARIVRGCSVCVNLCAPVAQLDRAAGFEPVGREFESLRAHHFVPHQSRQVRY